MSFAASILMGALGIRCSLGMALPFLVAREIYWTYNEIAARSV